MLEIIKTVLRISHSKLDGDINRNISTARAELIRLGISEEKASSEEYELINDAIITYCQYKYASNDKLQEGYWQSWQYQIDNLRKTVSYKDEV
jgi:uncharacterized phage protein (possible DNA packaging)